ncbi:GDSL esterase/lipase EXL3-like [Vigna unguiculata]|uniref:GDSL esterase/lipase EXL3-like n=1 Tax=Vigna unguiculata TaxID=3917 RepID=UPI001016B3BE|nr:GDSL esterase/lipase EXL3-like [Vigna unguiculata]
MASYGRHTIKFFYKLLKPKLRMFKNNIGNNRYRSMSLLCGKLLSQWLLVILMFQHVSALTIPNNETVPAVIVFGDSIVDTGNNNYISTLVKCNFPPYGRDFAEGNHPSGRFSNGLVPSDIIAAKFGVKKFLPPYLDPSLQLQDLLTGVSFASGGAGYDPLTAELVSVMSLSDQLVMFKEYIKKINDAVGGNRTTHIVSKSVYIICIGSDDIANTYTQSPFRRAEYDIPSYTDLMASEASKFLETLYGMGARRIGVFGVPAIGCVPSQRTMGGGLDRACVASSNEAAMLFNSKLSSQMDALGKKLPDTRLVYLDSYHGLLKMITNPAKYGFEVIVKGCCGTGNIEVSILCNRYVINTCSNSSDYIFWDSYHPTERAYYVLSTLTLDEKINQFF